MRNFATSKALTLESQSKKKRKCKIPPAVRQASWDYAIDKKQQKKDLKRKNKQALLYFKQRYLGN